MNPKRHKHKILTQKLRDEGVLKGLQDNLFEYSGVKKELNKELAQKEANVEGYKEQREELLREKAVEQKISNTELTKEGIEGIQQELSEVKSMIMNFKEAICKSDEKPSTEQEVTTETPAETPKENAAQSLLQFGGNRSRKRSLKHKKKRSKLRKKKFVN